MAFSKCSDAAFRSAAKRLHPTADAPLGGAVQRLADGGAFVEMMVWVPQHEAERDARRQEEERCQRPA